MAGKKKIAGGPSRPGWGGVRPNSGRPKIQALADMQAKILFREIKRRAKKEGRTWQSVLTDFIYGRTIDGIPMEMKAKDRISALKLIADLTASRQSEQSITVQHQQGPAISLPPLREDPALKIVGGSK